MNSDPKSSAPTSPDAAAPPDWSAVEPYFEAAIVTASSETDLAKIRTPAALAALLKPEHCGDPGTCDAVRAFLKEADHTKTEVVTAEHWTLPPADRIATATPDLTAEERAQVQTLPRVLVLRIGGKPGDTRASHLVARAGFAASAALAGTLHGFVYDEVRQRIESPRIALQACITAKLDAQVDPARQIALQALPVTAGSADPKPGLFRLTSHGMKRFGAPDVEIVCAESELGAAGTVLNALASSLVNHPTPSRSVAVRTPNQDIDVSLHRAPLAEAQPLNTVLRVTVAAGALGPTNAGSGGAWTDAATDDERKIAREAIERATKNGTVRGLMVRADFNSDAGIEAMWIELTGREGEQCMGLLRSYPTMATELHYGDNVRVSISTIDKVHGAPAAP